MNPGTNGGPTNDMGRIYENTFAAPYISWEIEKKSNFGIDMGLFRGRVDITADYFHNRREDILNSACNYSYGYWFPSKSMAEFWCND